MRMVVVMKARTRMMKMRMNILGRMHLTQCSKKFLVMPFSLARLKAR